MTLIACLALVAIAAATAQAGELVHLGQPCRARQVLAGRIVRDRADGREKLVLSNTNEDTGQELIFIDIENGTAKAYSAPAGAGSWAVDEVPGDRLIVGTFYDGTFMVFDLKKMQFVKTVKFPGESYIWNLATGGDGRVYGGTYAGGKLGALDLNTYTVEDLGAPAPPNQYLRYVTALPDGRILCNFGFEKPINMIFDPATKKFGPMPEHMKNVTIGVSYRGAFVAGSTVYDGKSLEKIDPPFPTPPADKGAWAVDTYMSTPEALYLHQGGALFRVTEATGVTLVARVDLRGGRWLAGTADGGAAGVRGQDYFVVKPGATDIELKPIPGDSGPRPTMFLRVDPEGTLWGGPHFGQTLYSMDPKTRKTVNTSNICDAGGEVYDVTFSRGKVYAAAYSGGDIVEYDPRKPWDQWGQKNPRVLADVGDRGYIRPAGGILTGPDGKLYSGWMAKYGTYGGAVAITNPITGDTKLIENPLGEQAIAGVAVGDGAIYAGTSISANGLPNKTGESARFGVLDPDSGKAVFEHTFDGAGTVRVLGYDPRTKRVAVSADGSIRLLDAVGRRFIADIPAGIPRVSCTSVAMRDGRIYYGSDRSVVALDVRTGAAETIGTAPEKITNVAVGPNGEVYISCGVDVYAVR